MKRHRHSLIKVDSYWLRPERVVGYKHKIDPVVLTVYLEGGHVLTLNKLKDIKRFKDKYGRYLRRNGIECMDNM